MRQKYAYWILGVVLGISVLSGCTETNTSVSDSGKSADNSLFGEVSKIGDNSIMVKVGTMKERKQGEQPKEGESMSPQDDEEVKGTDTDEDKGQQPPQEGEPPSMLELTGEEEEIHVTGETVIKRQEKPGKQQGDMSEVPKMPDGEFPSEQEAEVVLDAIDGETFAGTVTKVGNSASSASGGVAKYSVEITIPKNEEMKAGMNASATIVLTEFS